MNQITTKDIAHITYEALVDTINHDGVEHAGYIAFLFLLSLFPFLVFFFAIVGAIGQSELGTELAHIILDNALVPATVLNALKPRIEEIVSGPPQGLLTVAIIGAIWTASSSVEALRTILNRAYRVSTPPTYVTRRLLSVGQFLILTGAIVLVTSMLIVLPNIWQKFQELVDPTWWDQIASFFAEENKTITFDPIWNVLRYIFTIATLFGVVCIAYYTLPNTKKNWLNVMPGAFIVVCLWFLSGTLLSNYLSNFQQVNLIYGSLGGIIGALLFFYLAAMIFFFGAEFNYLLEKHLGHKIIEKETA